MTFYTCYNSDATVHSSKSKIYRLHRFDFAPHLDHNHFLVDIKLGSQTHPNVGLQEEQHPSGYNWFIFRSALVTPSISIPVDTRQCARVRTYHFVFLCVFTCMKESGPSFYPLCHIYRCITVSIPQEQSTAISHCNFILT